MRGKHTVTAPELKGWDCADVPDLTDWSPTDDEVIFWMNLYIGAPSSADGHHYQVCVATPAGLNSAPARRSRPKGAKAPPPIVLQTYSWVGLLEQINNRLVLSSGADWAEMQRSFGCTSSGNMRHTSSAGNVRQPCRAADGARVEDLQPRVICLWRTSAP
jgi:hypothetical protein